MIAKLTTGNGFSGALSYVTRAGEAVDPNLFRVLDACSVSMDYNYDGNLVLNNKLVARDFRQQVLLHEGSKPIRKPVYHWALAYSPSDNPSEEQMVEDAKEFLEKIGFTNTQYVITAHYDKQHVHLHVITNVVDNTGHRLVTKNLIDNAHIAAADITKKRGYSWGTKATKITQDNAYKPHEKVRIIVKPMVVDAVTNSSSLNELVDNLAKVGVTCRVNLAKDGKRGGISYAYEYDGQLHTFKGSSLDRQLSFGYVQQKLKKNHQEKQTTSEYKRVYYANYLPIFNDLKTARDKAYSMYEMVKKECGEIDQNIAGQYNKLRQTFAYMRDYSAEIEKAKNSEKTINAISAMLFLFAPCTALIISLVNSILMNRIVTEAKDAKRLLYAQAGEIKASIVKLKEEQDALRTNKSDKLSVYLENCDALHLLQAEMAVLQTELAKPNREITWKGRIAYQNYRIVKDGDVYNLERDEPDIRGPVDKNGRCINRVWKKCGKFTLIKEIRRDNNNVYFKVKNEKFEGEVNQNGVVQNHQKLRRGQKM